ncbi:MAG: hypothetical protein HZA92_15450 [Verrucomicrobia bacterium]|nr:hypothetical protein [Verrucomicrobiota bacterium]
MNAAPRLVGPMTAALLLARHVALTAKIKEVSDAELELSLKRADREQLFGDEAAEVREPNSIIARLLQYHATILGNFPGQPIADTLPRIFPQEAASLPRFDYNWRDLGGGQLKTWLRDPGLNLKTAVGSRKGREGRNAEGHFSEMQVPAAFTQRVRGRGFKSLFLCALCTLCVRFNCGI